jgi:hypothetical protein
MNPFAALRYLALPFHAAPLLLVTIFAVLLRLALHAGLLGLPALLIIGSWFFKYAFMLLDHAAEGRPGEPVLTPEAANPVGEMRPLAYALAAGVFYMGTGAIGGIIGPSALTVIRLLGLVALPAIIATHSITGSFVQALNPVAIVAMTRRLGAGYLLVIGVAIVAGLLGRAIVLDGAHLAFVLRIALLMLLWLLMFSVLGGVLHARRFEVGFEPEHSPERRTRLDERDRNRERDRFIDQVFAEFRAGGRGNPFASVQQRANQSSNPLAEYEWIHDRVATWPNPKLANRVAQELLPLLLSSRRHGDALRLVRSRLQVDSDFRPLASEHLLRLVELARDAGDRSLARALLSKFERHYPDDPLVTRAQRLATELAR